MRRWVLPRQFRSRRWQRTVWRWPTATPPTVPPIGPPIFIDHDDPPQSSPTTW